MKKKIFGIFICILLFILLFSIPSLSAKQQSMNKLDLRKTISFNDDIKYPNFYEFISFWLYQRFYRSVVLITISSFYDQDTGELIILKPIIYNRGVWLIYTASELSDYFQKLSDKFGWNWEMPI